VASNTVPTYIQAATDGGVFTFGGASFYGSMGGRPLVAPIVGMAATPGGGGYWLVASDGGVFSYGDASFYGSMGGTPLEAPVIAIAPSLGDGQATAAVSSATRYSPGSTGYDVSAFQENGNCSLALPASHSIGIVEVTGAASAYPNPCLAQEAAWAGSGLNLYIFLTAGTSSTPLAACDGDRSCNWGAAAAQYAVDYAASQGVDTHVTWWLDVEGAGTYWSTNLQANAAVVAGAIDALQGAGLTVGIYASALSFSGIVGGYQPNVPLWVAWYTGDPAANCATAISFAAADGATLPTGGVWITQYSDNNGAIDSDYAC